MVKFPCIFRLFRLVNLIKSFKSHTGDAFKISRGTRGDEAAYN